MRTARAMFGAALDPNQTLIIVAGGIDQHKQEIADCEVFDIK